MGEVSETMTKKKKKGRPSLLDLQKRSLKEQQQQQFHRRDNFNSISSRRNPVPEQGIAADDDEDERKQKKHKLLVGLDSHHQSRTLTPNSLSFNSVPHGVDSNENVDDPEATHKRRKINVAYPGSDETGEKVPKATDSKHGSQEDSGPTAPLPDKKLLLFILDRLQKKDTHGVFSEPVDPEELPDYHDIIEHPMDFGTVRKKLEGEVYSNLEEFEKDVLLICSNAMQYNASDTIYYRQARAMQEMAQKDFTNLRQDSDDSEPQPKVARRGRPPGKSIRKTLGMTPERVGPESSSDATLASGGDNAIGSNTYNLRNGLGKFKSADLSVRAPQSNFSSGNYTSWLSEWENEFPASVLKAVLRYGNKQFVVDETRRDTYMQPVASGNEPPVTATVGEELKQLLAVGLHVEHSYARSLARFAADLGPVVWKIAAKKIRNVLPVGYKFGPGWVGEDDESHRQHITVTDEERSLGSSLPEDYRSRFSGSLPVANSSCLQSRDMVINRGLNSQNEYNPLNGVGSGIEPMVPVRIQQESMVHSDDIFASQDRVGPNVSPQMRMVRLADLTGLPSSSDVSPMLHRDPIRTTCWVPTNVEQPVNAQILNNLSQSNSSNLSAQESGFELQRLSQGLGGKSSWEGLAMPVKQTRQIGASNAPNPNVQTVSQLQPNLSLQL